jgi:alpha-L-rhamnosidase
MFGRGWLLRQLYIVLTLGFSLAASGQSLLPAWVAPPGYGPGSAGIFGFRTVADMGAQPPKSLIVDVSADNRFLLYINGQRMGEGPARGDLQHWRYEAIDIGPALQAGKNVIAARVWSLGSDAPIAQIEARPAFVLWAPSMPALNTGPNWQVRTEPAWTTHRIEATGNFRTGPGETVDGTEFDWSWGSSSDNTPGWVPVQELGDPVVGGQDVGRSSGDVPWHLVPDTLPAMEFTPTALGRVVRVTGAEVKLGQPLKDGWTVPAHARVELLLDRGEVISAYPQVTVSGGAGARISLRYTEALVDAKGEKGNRNEVIGRHVDPTLLTDDFLSDGGRGREFSPLWWRAWRYVQVDITTGDEPLVLASLTARETEYPFQQLAEFHCDDPELERIWDAGWRTLRLDAHETFMDSAFWEQLQYIGDARVESLVSYAVSGDDRLARQMLDAMVDSKNSMGLTESRWPSNKPQVIPPFSLLWIGAMRDFWMYRSDTAPIAAWLPMVRSVLDWFTTKQRPDGLLGLLGERSYGLWEYLDWADAYGRGSAPQDPDGGSVPISLQFAQALREAADLENAYGDKALAEADRTNASHITTAAYREAWDSGRELLADTPAKKSFGEQANILGVMTDTIPVPQQQPVLQRILKDELAEGKMGASSTAVVPASFYFRFYLSRALDHAGIDDAYIPLLRPWREMLAMGLTTTAERPEPTRSDSHAWSAHPTYDLLTLVAGIRPDSPGFTKVLIAPHLGSLRHVAAVMPSPKGMIRVEFLCGSGTVASAIELPPGLTGRLQWQGKQFSLHSGKQKLRLDAR